MLIGTRLIAPEGFGSLPRDVVLHFIDSNARYERVLLVRFNWHGNGQQLAQLVSLGRKEFEEAVLRKEIIPTPKQPTLPPWLESLESENLALRDVQRGKVKVLHSERIDRRLMHIANALAKKEEIFAASDVECSINRYARQANSQDHVIHGGRTCWCARRNGIDSGS
jgi:hypothetical protein